MAKSEQRFACPTHLPPRDAWKIDPDRIQKFHAPTDDRGFVIPDATVETVKALFHDDYEWPVDKRLQATVPDLHHFHWRKRTYEPEHFGGSTIPREWRNLATVKAVLPRQFHNVIHKVTLPPELPNFMNMEDHLKAYRIARRLFQSAQIAAMTKDKFKLIVDENDDVANQMLIEQFDRHFRGYREDVEAMIESNAMKALGITIKKFERRPPKEIAKVLGRIVSIKEELSFLEMFPTRTLEAV